VRRSRNSRYSLYYGLTPWSLTPWSPLFMPYPQLHMATGRHGLKFVLAVWDRSGKTPVKLVESDWVNFQFSK